MEQTTLKLNRPVLPSWAMNLIGFGLLIGVVVAVFSWQIVAMNRDLQRNTLSRTRMMAAVIVEILANGDLAGTTIVTLTTTFLRDKARFVAYLNGIDPLQSDELAALARETGLLGLSVVNASGAAISGPENWVAKEPDCSQKADQLVYAPNEQTVLYSYRAQSADIRCILVGMEAKAILELRQKTALPVLLKNLSQLPGIHYVRMEPSTRTIDPNSVQLLNKETEMTAEARLSTSKGLLVVGLDAANHFSRLHQLRRQFFLIHLPALRAGTLFLLAALPVSATRPATDTHL